MQKLKTDEKRLSLIVPADTYEIISAIARIYNKSKNEVAGAVLSQFAENNKFALKEIEELRQAAREKLKIQQAIDFGDLNFDKTKKTAYDSDGYVNLFGDDESNDTDDTNDDTDSDN